MKLWEDLKKKKLSYDGEEYTEPVPLTLNQIETSLPPAGHGGSVDLVPLLVGRTRHLLQHPAANLLEKDMKEPGSNVGKVHIKPGEELGVWNLLKERGVTDWLPLSEVYRDTQGPFLSGLFGVEKPNKFATNGEPLLRVIMNLKPHKQGAEDHQGRHQGVAYGNQLDPDVPSGDGNGPRVAG